MINVTGVLGDPTGNPLPAHEIRITTREANSVVEEIVSLEVTDSNGTYNFNLTEGWFYMEILLNDTFMSVGDLIVNSGTPTPINLPDLLKYSDPVEIENITYPPFWQNLIEVLEDSPLTGSRVNRDQMVDTLVHVAEIKTTDVSDDALERKATYDTDVKSCDAQVTKQVLVYSDDVDNSLASQSEKVTSGTHTYQETIIVNDSLSVTGSKVAPDYTELLESTIDTSGLNDDRTITFKGTTYTSELDIDATSVGTKGTMTTSTGEVIHTTVLNSNVFTQSIKIGTTFEDSVTHSDTLSTDVYSNTVGTKVTSDTHTNDGTSSSKQVVVDSLTVGRLGNDTFEVDTANDIVRVRGQFRVSQLQDANGDPIIVKDGDTIFQVFQFSDSILGPWHDDMLGSDFWRRENISVNGVVDPNLWGTPYQFRYDTITGNPGDTIFIEFNYSPDGATSWTPSMKSGDAFRRERTVTNGVPGDWSAVTRIKGESGDEIEIRSQYSVDGINFWHDTFMEGDSYERRARFVNGLIDSPWSDPFQIVSTSAYKSTVFVRSEIKPTLPTDGSWNSPVPTGWNDGVPAGDLQLWSTSRIFSLNGLAPQQLVWTPVRAMTDTDLIDFEYSFVEEYPGNPTDDVPNWHNNATGADIWLAVRRKRNGVFGSWDVTRIKGEDGIDGIASYKSIVFKRAPTLPVTPTGGSWGTPVPSYWSDGVPSGTDRLWMTTRIFTSTGASPQQALWATPQSTSTIAEIDFEYSDAVTPGNPTDNPANWHNVATLDDLWLAQRTTLEGIPGPWNITKISGENGKHAFAAYKSLVFKRSGTKPTLPTTGDWDTPVPAGWSDGIPSGELQMWGTTRIFTEDGNLPQQSVWQPVVAMTDTALTDYEYSTVFPTPGNPTDNPGNWHNTATGADIFVALRTKTNGVFGAWQVNKIIGEDGQTNFKSIVFKRQTGTPTLPTGASFASPVPSGWSDGVPSGNLQLWSSTRVFSIDGLTPQQSVWTPVQAMTDTDTLDFEYSAVTSPGNPTANAANWHNDATGSDIWMAQRQITNGVVGAWNITKIKGETGDKGIPAFKSLVFKRASSTGTPSGGSWSSPIPTTSGWSDGIPSGNSILWGSSRIFTETGVSPQQATWTVPRQMTDTAGLEFQFSGVEDTPGNPSDNSGNWHVNAVPTDIWMAQRVTTNGVVGVWQILKIKGEDGVVTEGDQGIPGLNGSGWYTIVGNGGVWPGDTSANAQFITNFGRSPQLDDHLFFVDVSPNPTATDGRRCITPVGGTPAWNTPNAYFDGDVIVKNTLSANRLVSNSITGNEINSQTTIIAGSGSTTAGFNGYDGTTLPAWLGGGTNIYKDWRLWSGASNPASANFRVNDVGKLFASDVEIAGAIMAGVGSTTSQSYITDLAIDTADIADAAITTAKIGQLAVDSLRIADQAVTLPTAIDIFHSYSTGGTDSDVITLGTYAGGSIFMSLACSKTNYNGATTSNVYARAQLSIGGSTLGGQTFFHDFTVRGETRISPAMRSWSDAEIGSRTGTMVLTLTSGSQSNVSGGYTSYDGAINYVKK
jgi:hypothetical protein